MSDRKARLAALAAKAGRTKPEAASKNEHDANVPQHHDNDDTKQDDGPPQVKFRNYVPTTEEAAPSKKRARTDEKEPSALQQALLKAQKEIPSSDDAAMGPRKINWDLKRDIQPKLDRLERRTQRAIVELLRQRLEQEAENNEEREDSDSDLD